MKFRFLNNRPKSVSCYASIFGEKKDFMLCESLFAEGVFNKLTNLSASLLPIFELSFVMVVSTGL